ncbi:rossmann fold nucleotide-binding protein for DNA uptake [Lapidilactobacillus dextrinicus DSM 20335]|uniref:Rossmann fold nucleotide-binding protein for DNA uptake n=1 Tax=Lapidilactobacillus dextrinicus DSM 20335 TaxID=1423738 RepID=A0A0R2BJD1_9LACO|nr:DNA-processing protein DprA [Lapidilactobacillus dextrinicus]KRM79216.1 rossmann fold nucleotide-binding protein for DNA uptake [Lapidilactobacillus dextrinicus DSM 20335]QFG46942.1 DNA-protecting protein DprA [Lapidilactobacillus dextrinicus]
MEKNEILLAAKMNKNWHYREQLNLVKLLQMKPDTEIFSHWETLNLFLRTQLTVYPSWLEPTKTTENYLTIFDSDYPIELAEIYQPPVLLFYRGRRELLARRKLAIVGARMCTTYSQHCLRRMLPELVAAGWVTVSGLAAGVDTLVHQETLSVRGSTIAVIGNGLNVVYPSANQSLQEQISREGLLLSEYLPDSPPQKFHFPQRNRIIAGLTEGTLVTEAKQRSGSLITANLALQENRNVYAIPGGLFSPLSVGTNQLIQAGAMPVLKASDLLDDLSLNH